MARSKLDMIGSSNRLIKEIASKLSSDRRSDPRAISFFRPIVINVGTSSGFCLLLNLSPNGMMGVAYTRLDPHQDITVQFDEAQSVSGTITWSDPKRFGVNFHEPIDMRCLLERLRRSGHRTLANRALRVAVNVPCAIRTDTLDIRSTMVNISQRGLNVSTSALREHDEVQVFLEEMNSRRAIVRWCTNGFAGLNFATPLDFVELAKWVAKMNFTPSEG